jgi:hypothetical protein
MAVCMVGTRVLFPAGPRLFLMPLRSINQAPRSKPFALHWFPRNGFTACNRPQLEADHKYSDYVEVNNSPLIRTVMLWGLGIGIVVHII